MKYFAIYNPTDITITINSFGYAVLILPKTTALVTENQYKHILRTYGFLAGQGEFVVPEPKNVVEKKKRESKKVVSKKKVVKRKKSKK